MKFLGQRKQFRNVTPSSFLDRQERFVETAVSFLSVRQNV